MFNIFLLSAMIPTSVCSLTDSVSNLGAKVGIWAALISGILVITGVLAKLFKMIKVLDTKNENIDKIPKLSEVVETIVKEDKEKNQVFLNITLTLEKIATELKELQTIKVPVYDKNTEILKELTETIERHCQNDEMKNRLLLSQTKQLLIEEATKAIKAGEVDTETYLYINALYKDYHATNANGISDIMEKFKNLKIKN